MADVIVGKKICGRCGFQDRFFAKPNSASSKNGAMDVSKGDCECMFTLSLHNILRPFPFLSDLRRASRCEPHVTVKN